MIYISGVIRQDDFQSGNHKDKSSQKEIMKKKTTSKKSVFQDPSFIRSLCKVVGAFRIFMHYILYLCTKIIQELFCFKYFKNWMISCFQLKPCVKCFSNLVEKVGC